MELVDLESQRRRKAEQLIARFEEVRAAAELNGVKSDAITEAITKMVHAGIGLAEIQAALRSAASEIDEIISFE